MRIRSRIPQYRCLRSGWSGWSVRQRLMVVVIIVAAVVGGVGVLITSPVRPVLMTMGCSTNPSDDNDELQVLSQSLPQSPLKWKLTWKLELWFPSSWHPFSNTNRLQQHLRHVHCHHPHGDKDGDDDGGASSGIIHHEATATRTTAASKTTAAITLFPTAWEVLEMAKLSRLVYTLKGQTECNVTRMEPMGLVCHYYKHDIDKGTQVLIVSWSKSITTVQQQQSQSQHDYVAVVFCGTDDLRTSLADGDILLKPFGPLMPSEAHVHAGFANNVQDIQDDVLDIVRSVIQNMTNTKSTTTSNMPRLYTTGHSLGAADAVLLSTYMVLKDPHFMAKYTDRHMIQSITFGCPKIGNSEFRMAVHALEERFQIWRFVLGWDLVPRLPEYPFVHVGHTLQMKSSSSLSNENIMSTFLLPSLSSSKSVKLSSNNKIHDNEDDDDLHNKLTDTMMMTTRRSDSDDNDDDTAKAYYHHTGNQTLMYASVPFGWGTTSFLWIPGALYAHRMIHYLDHIHDIVDVDPLCDTYFINTYKSNKHQPKNHSSCVVLNITHFERINDSEHHHHHHDDTQDDDDFPIIPPIEQE